MSQHPTDAELLTALRAGLESRPVPSPELAAFLADPSSSPVAPMVPVDGGAGGTGLRRVSAASRWVMAVAAVLVLLVGAGAGHVLPGPVQDAFDTVVRVVLPDRGREPRMPGPSPEPSRRPVPTSQVPEQDPVPADRPARSDGIGAGPRDERDDERDDEPGGEGDVVDDGADDTRDREEELAEQQQERREDQRDRREEQRDRAEDAAEEEADEAADAAEDAHDDAEDEAEDARDREEDREEEGEKEREKERRD